MKKGLSLGLISFLVGLGILIASSFSLAAGKGAKIEDGKKVTLVYKLFVEGKMIESADAKEPFIYTHGTKQIVPGLEKGLAGLSEGEQKTIRILPEDGFGPIDGKALREIEAAKLPPDIPREVGTFVEARNPAGESMLVKITKIKDKTVVLDFDHPLAGKELEFQVEVLKVN